MARIVKRQSASEVSSGEWVIFTPETDGAGAGHGATASCFFFDFGKASVSYRPDLA